MGMPIAHRRFTVEEYHRMAEAGILSEDDRVELLDGQVVPMTPIGARHAGCVTALTNLLARVLEGQALVSVQNPVRLDRFEEPQPDIAILAPRPDTYRSGLPGPNDVFLLIEVADTSASSDVGTKVALYARFRVREFWLVDLRADRIEVFRAPRARRYMEHRIVGRGVTLSPLAFPDASIGVDAILG